MNTRTIQLIIFIVIFILITLFAIRSSFVKMKREIVVVKLFHELSHIEQINQAKLEYQNIYEISKVRRLPNDVVNELAKRAYKIFKDEKYNLGKDKDLLISELKGMTGDIYEDILAFDKAVDKWCISVKDDTIESFAASEAGDKKFHALMRIRDDIVSLQRKYGTGILSWSDALLLGVPLFAATIGIAGQLYSMFRRSSPVGSSPGKFRDNSKPA